MVAWGGGRIPLGPEAKSISKEEEIELGKKMRLKAWQEKQSRNRGPVSTY